MLHFYYSPNPSPMRGTAVYEDVVTEFLREGLVEAIDPNVTINKTDFKVTSRGCAWVEAICSTPYPKQVWIDPRTEEKLGE